MAAADPSPDSELEYLCLAHLNIRSLRKNYFYVKNILTNEKLHVLALTETHLDNSVKNPEIHIKEFKIYRNDRKRRGGGVALYIHKNVKVSKWFKGDDEDLEIIWAEISLPCTRPVLVGCCYRAPRSKIEIFNKICRQIEIMSNKDIDICLLGDFNIDWLKETTKKTRIDFVSSVCGLTQIMKEPTRVDKSRSTSTCIDHIYTNIPKLCSKPLAISLQKSVSDHKLITAKVRRRVRRCRKTKKDCSVLSELPEFLLINNIMENKHCRFKFRRVEDKKVKRLLSLVNAYLLQTEAQSISAICHILNSCIDRNEFPSERHESFIFRPILEKVLLQQMVEYFKKNELFTHHKAFANITDQWLTELKKKRKVGVVFMDFTPSSDVISHDLLLYKLKSYRFSDSAISMMRSFLSDGNSCSCPWTDTPCKLPRGSCMTRFLFSVHTNDLKVTLKSGDVIESGGHLMMYHSEKKYQDLQEVLREKLEVVRGWLIENRMVLKRFTSTVIKKNEPLMKIQTCLKFKLNSEFNWIRILGVLLHDAPHLVWKS